MTCLIIHQSNVCMIGKLLENINQQWCVRLFGRKLFSFDLQNTFVNHDRIFLLSFHKITLFSFDEIRLCRRLSLIEFHFGIPSVLIEFARCLNYSSNTLNFPPSFRAPPLKIQGSDSRYRRMIHDRLIFPWPRLPKRRELLLANNGGGGCAVPPAFKAELNI